MRERERVLSGCYPWNSIDASVAVKEPCPVDGEIERKKCLACPYPECINCLCKDETTKRIDQIEELISKKISKNQICKIMNISRSAYYNYMSAGGFITPMMTRRLKRYENY